MKRAFHQIGPPKDYVNKQFENEDASMRLMLKLKMPAKEREICSPNQIEYSGPPILLRVSNMTDKRNKMIELTAIYSLLPVQSPTKARELCDKLLLNLQLEQASSILIKIIEILCQLSLSPYVDSSQILEGLKMRLKSVFFAEKFRIVPSILNAISVIGKSKQIIVSSVYEDCHKLLSTYTCPMTRISALKFLFGLSTNSGLFMVLHSISRTFMNDPDGRVRKTSFQLIREHILKDSKQKSKNHFFDKNDVHGALESVLFKESIEGLVDDEEEVRLEALRTIWTIASQNSRFVDETFRKICNMVSDTSIKVRSEACLLLGTLRGVSTSLMLQSLSKKLLKVADAKNDPFDPSTGDTQQTDVINFNSKSKLIDSGANGAFIHGLEDEFMQVRNAAVSSICELSHRSTEFALAATEFFVDMFNDEIDSVRINAIQSLSRIGKVIFLNEEQLLVVLAILDDATHQVRLAVRELLQSIRLINFNCMQITVNALMQNLMKFNLEKESLLQTFKALGTNHPQFVELLIEHLLRLDSRFLMREPRLNDIFYIATLILVLNAAKENVNITSLLPPFIPRHYKELKNHYPSLMPELTKLNKIEFENSSKHKEIIKEGFGLSFMLREGIFGYRKTDDNNSKRLISDSIEKIAKISNFEKATKFDFLALIHDFTKVLMTEDTKYYDTCHFYIRYFELLVKLKTIEQRKTSAIRSNTSSENSTNIFILPNSEYWGTNYDELIQESVDLQNLFLGFSNQDSSNLQDLTSLIQILFVISIIENQDDFIKSAEIKSISARLKNASFSTFFKQQKYETLVRSLSEAESSENNHKNHIMRQILECFDLEDVKLVNTSNMLKKSICKILSPETQTTPREFYPNMPVIINCEFELKNVDDLTSIQILVQNRENLNIVAAASVLSGNIIPLKPLLYTVQADVSLNLGKFAQQSSNILDLEISIVKRREQAFSRLSEPLLYSLRPKLR